MTEDLTPKVRNLDAALWRDVARKKAKEVRFWQGHYAFMCFCCLVLMLLSLRDRLS